MEANKDSITILQYTDTHLNADSGHRMHGVSTFETLKHTIYESLKSCGVPDLVLLTGDVSQDGSRQSYEHVYQAVREIRAPVCFLPGNHDLFQVMLTVFSEDKPEMRSDRTLNEKDWQIVLLDSTIDGAVAGLLSEAELERLDTLLTRSPQKHALVCMHHPPMAVGSAVFDDIGVQNPTDFFEVIDRHSNVRGVLCGHVHQEFSMKRQGVTYMASPSTCFQFKPRVSTFAIDALPPGYRQLKLHADGRIETTVFRLSNLPEGLILTSATG